MRRRKLNFNLKKKTHLVARLALPRQADGAVERVLRGVCVNGGGCDLHRAFGRCSTRGLGTGSIAESATTVSLLPYQRRRTCIHRRKGLIAEPGVKSPLRTTLLLLTSQMHLIQFSVSYLPSTD